MPGGAAIKNLVLLDNVKLQPEAPKDDTGDYTSWSPGPNLTGTGLEPGRQGIDKLRQDLGKKLGGEVKLHSFFRYGLGDGIEKKVDDLAAEVAKMTGG